MKFKIAGGEYEIPESFTLGELRLLKREFGISDLSALSAADPDHMVGMIFITIRRQNPDVTIEDVEAMDSLDIVTGNDEDDSVPPTVAAAAATS